MKKKIVFLVAGILFLMISCNNRDFIRRLQEYEEGVKNPTTIEDLSKAIKKYERRVNDIMIAEGRVGLWYKMLASRYYDQKMYKKALECYRAALEYYPENQNLFYYVGVCAGQMAKASLDFEKDSNEEMKKHYFDLAVSSYRRAIEIDPKYTRAIYGLSILYVFELDQPERAIPLLESVVEREKKPLKSLFVLARAYFVTGQSQKAIDAYTQIIDTSGSAEQRAEAEKNRKIILDIINK